jgi:hypothetical protein
MKSKYLIIGASLITTLLTTSAWTQQDERLGKVSFPTSCDPKVQAEFERAWPCCIPTGSFMRARRLKGS